MANDNKNISNKLDGILEEKIEYESSFSNVMNCLEMVEKSDIFFSGSLSKLK